MFMCNINIMGNKTVKEDRNVCDSCGKKVNRSIKKIINNKQETINGENYKQDLDENSDSCKLNVNQDHKKLDTIDAIDILDLKNKSKKEKITNIDNLDSDIIYEQEYDCNIREDNDSSNSNEVICKKNKGYIKERNNAKIRRRKDIEELQPIDINDDSNTLSNDFITNNESNYKKKIGKHIGVYNEEDMWFLTIFYGDVKHDQVNIMVNIKPYVKWGVYQVEKGRVHNKVHAQCVIKLKHSFDEEMVKECFDYTMYITKAENVECCVKYCIKTNTRIAGPFFLGNPLLIPGIRRILREQKLHDSFFELEHLKEYKTQILSGSKTYEQIYIENYTFAKKHEKILKKYEKECLTVAKKSKCDLIYVYGPPGVGKTLFCKNLGRNDHQQVFFLTNESFWWDGYKGQKSVVLDEFDKKSLNPKCIKFISDSTSINLQIKGDTVTNNIEQLFICSNYKLGINFKKNDYVSINRRIRDHIQFDFKCVNKTQYVYVDWRVFNTEMVPKHLLRNIQCRYLTNDVLYAVEEMILYVRGYKQKEKLRYTTIEKDVTHEVNEKAYRKLHNSNSHFDQAKKYAKKETSMEKVDYDSDF